MTKAELQPSTLKKEDQRMVRESRIIPGLREAPKNLTELREFFTKLGRDDLAAATGLDQGGGRLTKRTHLTPP